MQASMLLDEAAAAAGQSGHTLESSVLAPLLSGGIMVPARFC